MPDRADIAVAADVEQTCSPSKYVSVLPVIGMPSTLVCATRGISNR